MVLPIGACVFAIALFSNIAQVGFLYTTEPLAPKLEKIDPLKGFQRIISLNSVVELIKSISKIAIVTFVVYLTMKGEVEKVAPLILMSPMEIVRYISAVSFNILMKSSWVLLLLAALDYAYQKWDYEKKLRMTKQEIKDESKQSDGDPQQKARVKSLQREWAMSRMMDEVLKADVVITNPTHFAIALKYNKDEMGAPRVVAKGRNHLAQRIKELAIGAGVPIVEDKPLARAIFKSIDVGGEIPANLYKAVAEILVHIYKLKGGK
jgi:flagellar biosynthetic protein FlhB